MVDGGLGVANGGVMEPIEFRCDTCGTEYTGELDGNDCLDAHCNGHIIVTMWAGLFTKTK